MVVLYVLVLLWVSVSRYAIAKAIAVALGLLPIGGTGLTGQFGSP